VDAKVVFRSPEKAILALTAVGALVRYVTMLIFGLI
jgi:hypothetical protein